VPAGGLFNEPVRTVNSPEPAPFDADDEN